MECSDLSIELGRRREKRQLTFDTLVSEPLKEKPSIHVAVKCCLAFLQERQSSDVIDKNVGLPVDQKNAL